MPILVTTENDILTGPAQFEADLGHVEVALARLIARWAADERPNLAVFVRAFAEEVQELEDAIWFVLYGRMLDYAEGAQLDVLGRIVGQLRSGLSDDAYRVHITARIRINRSIGTPADVIDVLRLVDSVPFHLVEYGTSTFLIFYDAPPTNAATGHEIPSLIRQTRAAGVRALVSFPVDRVDGRGAFFGSVSDPTLNATRGFSSTYDGTVGGLFGHAAEA